MIAESVADFKLLIHEPYKYSMVPNNSAARLFIFSEFVPPTRLIWHYITVQKNTYTLINFQGFCPTYTVIWTPRLFGTLEYIG
jgi:hypothetical protein